MTHVGCLQTCLDDGDQMGFGGSIMSLSHTEQIFLGEKSFNFLVSEETSQFRVNRNNY